MDKGLHSFLGGAAAGTAAGGVAGFLAGLAAFGVPGLGPVVAGGIWATTLAAAAEILDAQHPVSMNSFDDQGRRSHLVE